MSHIEFRFVLSVSRRGGGGMGVGGGGKIYILRETFTRRDLKISTYIPMFRIRNISDPDHDANKSNLFPSFFLIR